MVITEALPHSDGLHHPTWLPTQSEFLSILHQRGTTHGHLALRAKADKVPALLLPAAPAWIPKAASGLPPCLRLSWPTPPPTTRGRGLNCKSDRVPPEFQPYNP